MHSVWNPSDLVFIAFCTGIFFFCFGFSLWRALLTSQSGVYWHITLCLIWLGVISAAVAGSRVEVWTVMLNIGYAMLCSGVLMTFAGIAWQLLHYMIFQRGRYQRHLRHAPAAYICPVARR